MRGIFARAVAMDDELGMLTAERLDGETVRADRHMTRERGRQIRGWNLVPGHRLVRARIEQPGAQLARVHRRNRAAAGGALLAFEVVLERGGGRRIVPIAPRIPRL